MRVVADTNVFVSGLLWSGPPNQIMKWARDGRLEIPACEQTAAELKRVLQYQRFSKRLTDLQVTAQEVFAYFINIAHFVADTDKIPNTIRDDPFDNIFLALAEKHDANLIISGDQHLLNLAQFHSIQIVTPAEAVQVVKKMHKI